MSRQTALDNIWLRPANAWARTEYSLEYHLAFARKFTAADPASPEGSRVIHDALGLDFIWRTQDGLYGEWSNRGRSTDMGHAEYAEAGVDRREPAVSPFRSVEDVWAFDPNAEYGLPGFEDQVAEYERITRKARETHPNQLTTGGYYKTIVSGAIQAFGWHLLLEAAADRRKIAEVFHRFFERTLFTCAPGRGPRPR